MNVVYFSCTGPCTSACWRVSGDVATYRLATGEGREAFRSSECGLRIWAALGGGGVQNIATYCERSRTNANYREQNANKRERNANAPGYVRNPRSEVRNIASAGVVRLPVPGLPGLGW